MENHFLFLFKARLKHWFNSIYKLENNYARSMMRSYLRIVLSRCTFVVVKLVCTVPNPASSDYIGNIIKNKHCKNMLIVAVKEKTDGKSILSYSHGN